MTTTFNIHAVLNGEIPAPPLPTRVPGRIDPGRIYRGVTIDPLNIMGLIEPQPEQLANIHGMLAGQPSPYDRRRFEQPVDASSSESLVEVTYSAIRVASYEKDAMADSRPWRVVRENRQRTRAERHRLHRLQDSYRTANHLQALRDDTVRNQRVDLPVRVRVRGRVHNNAEETRELQNDAVAVRVYHEEPVPPMMDSPPSLEVATDTPTPVTQSPVTPNAGEIEMEADVDMSSGSVPCIPANLDYENEDINFDDIPEMSHILANAPSTPPSPEINPQGIDISYDAIPDMSLVLAGTPFTPPTPQIRAQPNDTRRVRYDWSGVAGYSTEYSEETGSVFEFFADDDSTRGAHVRAGPAESDNETEGFESVGNEESAGDSDHFADDESFDENQYDSDLDSDEDNEGVDSRDESTGDEVQLYGDEEQSELVAVDDAMPWAANAEEDYVLSGAESPSSFEIEGTVPDMSDFGSVVGNEEEIVPPQESDENGDDSDDRDDRDDDQPAVGTVADTAQSCGSSVECEEARPAGPKGKVRFADNLEEEMKAARRTAVRMKEMEKEKAAAERCRSVRDRVRQTCAKVRGGLRRMFCLA